MAYSKKVDEVEREKPFPTRLRYLMEEKNCTLKELSSQIGVTYQAVGAYRDGRSFPALEVAQKIADYFDVSLDYLSGRTNTKSSNTGVKAICKSTLLTEESAKTLTEIDSAIAINFINFILETDTAKLVKIGNKFFAFMHSKKVVEPVANAHAEELKEKKIYADIMINNEKMPQVPIQDLTDYARFELLRAFTEIVDDESRG